jgi:Fe-Mn family superoxide dismutase
MQSEVTRREALAGAAAGFAALSLNQVGLAAPRSTAAKAGQDSKPAARPPEYAARDYSGLVGIPGFSKPLLENHFTLYQGYVTNVNKAAAALAEHAKAGSASAAPAAELRRRFGWEFNGMRLHELYFENLGGGQEAPAADNKAAMKIASSFGSVEAWQKEFRAIGAMRGIGWVALVHDTWSGRLFNTWINEHDGGVLAASPIIVIMDVFEHAYITDYGIKKADYVDAFMKSINWANVANRV